MDIDLDQEIIRRDDGTLVVTLVPERGAEDDGDRPAAGETVTLHAGEGGYDDALAAWDLQQHPDRPAAVSTASGREQAMDVIHAVAAEPGTDVHDAVESVDDPQAAAEALRHVLVGGEPSVAAFAAEVADAHHDEEPLPTHTVTKSIGNVLSELED
jgi:hypothetical protein